MNKPRWRDKWRALSDMRAARSVAQGTTSESMTTDQRGASAVDFSEAKMQIASSIQRREEILQERKAMKLLSFPTIYNSQIQEEWQNYYRELLYERARSFLQELEAQQKTPYASYTEPLTESPAVPKPAPIQITGQTVLSITTLDQPSEPSPSSTTTPPTDEW